VIDVSAERKGKRTAVPSVESTVDSIPRRMGVYFLKDSDDRIIYVGKAVDLHSRIRSHLSGGSTHSKPDSLTSQICSVDFIPCETEVEALILEQNLIKEHQPKYNIDLKDDKRYPYLKLTDENYPRVFKTRDISDDGARYFGPYTSVAAMESMLKSLLFVFPLRTCDYEIPFSEPSMRECLEYHIGRCEAPCTEQVSLERYRKMVDEVALFLEGHTETLLDQMESEMEAASRARNYEHASVVRNRMRSIRRSTERQRVVADRRVDFDVLAHARESKWGVGVILQVREGRLVGRDTYSLRAPLKQGDDELLSGLILRHYIRASHIPPTVYLSLTLQDKDLIEKALSDRAGRRTRLRLGRQGSPAAVLELASTDARYRLRDQQVKLTQKADFVPRAVRLLQEELDLPRPPHRIEAIDVSHVQGTDAVAAVVSFHRGAPEKKRYRKLKLREAMGGDDPAGIAEAVDRHYKRLLKEKGIDGLPDLLLIDGGPTQLAAAVRVLNSLGIDRQSLPVLGLAKRLEEIYLPGVEGPQSLARTASALRLLQRVRDEVHRFALGYHRERRSGRVKATLLTEVTGVGSERARRLLQTFGSVARMLQSGEEAIARADGIGPVLARRIMDAMGGEGQP